MDIVIAIVPLITLGYGFTAAGPALIKGILNKHGIESCVVDYNHEYHYKNSKEDIIAINRILENFNYFNQESFKKIETMCYAWASELLSKDSKWIGISVLSYDSYTMTRLLAIMIKSIDPTANIVIGGNGLGDANGKHFCKTLLDAKIIDAYIIGEVGDNIIQLLYGNLSACGINDNAPCNSVVDLNKLPFPDYSDYKLDDYTNLYGVVSLPITGSRGCVRNCTFCDIKDITPRFVYRTGESIVNEIINGVEKYGVKSFTFTDSLINGSRSTFDDMISNLAKYRMSLPLEKRFIFNGHFIVRGKKHMSENTFELMKKAGVGTLFVGVESGSETVRNHMKKGFSQMDLDYCMKNFSKYQIKIRMLMIVGYFTETMADFEDTIQMLENYKQYSDDGTISEVRMGLTMQLLPGAPLYKNMNKYGIIYDGLHGSAWTSIDNPSLTFAERLRRRMIIQQNLERLGYNTLESAIVDKELYVKWNEYAQYIESNK